MDQELKDKERGQDGIGGKTGIKKGITVIGTCNLSIVI